MDNTKTYKHTSIQKQDRLPPKCSTLCGMISCGFRHTNVFKLSLEQKLCDLDANTTIDIFKNFFVASEYFTRQLAKTSLKTLSLVQYSF